MAGAGYKLFAVGDVLTAAQVNTYLQEQTVMSFADAAARTSALSAVLAEGMMSYLRDTNAVQVYNGSAWVAVGSSSPLTTKGDLYGFSTLDARIPIGTNNQVLTADSAQALGLKWATPTAAAQNFSLLGTGTLTGATNITVSGISGMNDIQIHIIGASCDSASATVAVQFNSDTGSNYYRYGAEVYWPSTYVSTQMTAIAGATTSFRVGAMSTSATGLVSGYLAVRGCNSAGKKMITAAGSGTAGGGTDQIAYTLGGYYNSSSTISSVTVRASANFDAGTFEVYGSA
jgi:hypothetical protein